MNVYEKTDLNSELVLFDVCGGLKILLGVRSFLCILSVLYVQKPHFFT